MGWLDNPLKEIDNALGSNLSGQGPGGIITQAGNAINRSDLGRYVGGQLTNAGRSVGNTAAAISDLARGDTNAAGRSLGRAVGSSLNYVTQNRQQLVMDNEQSFKDAGKYTAGYSEDLVGYSRGVNSLADRAYVSDEDRNSAIRYVGKSALITAGAAYAPEIYAYGAEKFAAKPLESLTVAGLATQGKSGQAKAAEIILGGVPLPDELRQPITDGITRIINPPPSVSSDPTEFAPWKDSAVPGTAYVPGGTVAGGGSTSMILVAGILAVGALIVLRKRHA
jgi:hypothetical protein